MAKKRADVTAEESEIDMEEVFDPENFEILNDILAPAEETFDLLMVSRKKIRIRYLVQGQAAGMEAMSGESRAREGDKINATRDKKIYLKRINPALINVQFADQIRGNKNFTPFADGDGRTVLPLAAVTTQGWNSLLETVFPGTFQTPEDIQAGANAGRNALSSKVPVSGATVEGDSGL